MTIPTGTDGETPDPLRHVHGYGAWSSWWHFPVVLTLATTATVVAAVLVTGVGPGAEGVLPLDEAAGQAIERGPRGS